MQVVCLTKDLLGHVHQVRRCMNIDVESHFALIAHWIPEPEHEEFKTRMKMCIDNGSAFCLIDDSCFLYYLNYKPCCANAVALFGQGSALKVGALFAGIFENIDTHTIRVNFKLHPGKMVQEYKSILTIESMKRRHLPNYPLVVRVDKVKKKMIDLLNKRNIAWVN